MLSEQELPLLRRVFNEQYEVGEDGTVTVRDKKLISANSVQNPHDPDAAYRGENGKKVKGYSTNITETCDEKGKPSLPSRYDLHKNEDGTLTVTDKLSSSTLYRHCQDACGSTCADFSSTTPN